MVNELKKNKIILIGGSPMIGKTSLAIKIASQLEYCCISTDDIGEAVRALIKKKDINPMKGFDCREYYIKKTIKKLIDETFIQHLSMEKSIMSVIRAHHEWGPPVVIEGWNLYPEFMSRYKKQDIISFYLVANKKLFRSRILNNKSFCNGASNEEKMIENYLARTEWHNTIIQKQAEDFNENIIYVNENDSTDDLLLKIKKECFD